jgi:serine phosphatase RsbU (regulator of sigma subunit)
MVRAASTLMIRNTPNRDEPRDDEWVGHAMRRIDHHAAEHRPEHSIPALRTRPRLSAVSPAIRHLQKEVQRAARVQRSLLPDVSMPVGDFTLASLYCPCEPVGGDFYDLAWRHDCALLLVSDARGHGVEAALTTMAVKAAFQESAAETGEPAALLAHMNARLQRILGEGMFVAAAAARLDLQQPDIQLANAALPYPFVLHASGGRVEDVDLSGLPLGLFGDRAAYEVRTVTLEPRDVLLIASDGIGTIEGKRGQCFEDHRLRQVLTRLTGHEGRKVIEGLWAEALAFNRGRPLPDDINIIAISRRTPGGPGIEPAERGDTLD